MAISYRVVDLRSGVVDPAEIIIDTAHSPEDAVRAGDMPLVGEALQEIHDAVQKQHVWQPDGLQHRSSVLEGTPLPV